MNNADLVQRTRIVRAKLIWSITMILVHKQGPSVQILNTQWADVEQTLFGRKLLYLGRFERKSMALF